MPHLCTLLEGTVWSLLLFLFTVFLFQSFTTGEIDDLPLFGYGAITMLRFLDGCRCLLISQVFELTFISAMRHEQKRFIYWLIDFFSHSITKTYFLFDDVHSWLFSSAVLPIIAGYRIYPVKWDKQTAAQYLQSTLPRVASLLILRVGLFFFSFFFHFFMQQELKL